MMEHDHWVLVHQDYDAHAILGIYHTEPAARLRQKTIRRQIAAFAPRRRVLNWAIYYLPTRAYDLLRSWLIRCNESRWWWTEEEVVIEHYPGGER